jgi:hypothetical protein
MKTAVERLQAKLWENNMLTNDDLKLFKEALEIEKEQHKKTYFKGWDSIGNRDEDFEQYYKENFKSE